MRPPRAVKEAWCKWMPTCSKPIRWRFFFQTRKVISQPSSISISGSTKRNFSGASRRRPSLGCISTAPTLFASRISVRPMGFDALYLLRKLTRNFREPLPYGRVWFSLVEGDRKLIAGGQRILEETLASALVDFEYYHHPLVEILPLQEGSHNLVICSEVVEHLEEPEKLLGELFGILRPWGFLILTTDNSPNVLQWLKRVPVWLSGKYSRNYARPAKESDESMRRRGRVQIPTRAGRILYHRGLGLLPYTEKNRSLFRRHRGASVKEALQ
jgi:SAM-dependent methyltransferase